MSRRSAGALAFAAACLLLHPRPAGAHPVPFSYLDVRLQPEALELVLVLHTFDVAHELNIEEPDRLLDPELAARHAEAIARLVSARLMVRADGRPVSLSWSGVDVLTDRQSLRVRATGALERPPGAVAIAGPLFPYDPRHRTFVNLYEGEALSQAILGDDRQSFEYYPGTPSGRFAVVRTFIPAGIHHILIGPDHILFLIGLMLLGGTVRRLALIVTGFTVAHSVTLSLAALNILSPPAGIVEPAIALSIVYVGADNLLKREGRDFRAWIALGFGFIHGFGFAGVLREMGLPSQALGWSLFSFNIGVELGQLAVVAVVATALGALRARNEVAGQRLAWAGSIVVIAAGAFWFTERVIFSGGVS